MSEQQTDYKIVKYEFPTENIKNNDERLREEILKNLLY